MVKTGYIFFLALLLINEISCKQSPTVNILNFRDINDTKDYFHYTGNDIPIISGHRGGGSIGYPENCISTFDYTLSYTSAIFEIDPRLTKDSVIVLMHDPTLDRTSNGHGKIIDYTWEEVKLLKLKDGWGNVTSNNIPTLDEAIEWSIGRTVINLDVKNVPLKMKAELVKKYDAYSNVIFTVHNAKEAKYFFDFDNRSLFSAFTKTKEAIKEYEDIGIPWSNVLIGYVGSKNTPENEELYKMLHERGVMVMVSTAPSYDKIENAETRAEAYREIIKDGADIIESDRPVEVANTIKSMYPKVSSKYKYWESKN